MNTTPTDHKIEFMACNNQGEIRKVFGIDKYSIYFYKELEGDYKSYGIFPTITGDAVSEWVLMQLTALRSINDDPIYNHMIVKNELGSLYIVDMFDYTIMFILSNEKLEIVGNRFQHSELLELCK